MKLSHLISAFIILSLTLLFAGCQTSRPIKTTLNLTTDPSPALTYSSEKDVIYSRITTDPTTGIIDSVSFKALASPAAYAQAERDTIQAQANAANAAAAAESMTTLAAIAAQVIRPTAQPVIPAATVPPILAE